VKIVWLPLAQRDLLEILGCFESVASKDVGNRIVHRIVHSAEYLIDTPYLGRSSESAAGVHEWQVARLPYLLPYRVVDDRVEILRVFHESQDRPSAWRGD
jgi:plasmid stabilization system protein ParE